MPTDQLNMQLMNTKPLRTARDLMRLLKEKIKNLVVAKDNPEIDLDKNTLNVTTVVYQKGNIYNDKLDKNDFFKSKQQV